MRDFPRVHAIMVVPGGCIKCYFRLTYPRDLRVCHCTISYLRSSYSRVRDPICRNWVRMVVRRRNTVQRRVGYLPRVSTIVIVSILYIIRDLRLRNTTGNLSISDGPSAIFEVVTEELERPSVGIG